MKPENSNADLRALHDAFQSLEQRADATHVSPFTVGSTDRSTSRWGVRVLAPVGAAAVVAAAAVTVAVWPHSSSPQSGAPVAGGQSAPGSSAVSPQSSPSPSSPVSSSATRDGHYLPPQTGRELAAKTRAILAGTATISVAPDALSETTSAPMNLAPALSGAPVEGSGVPALPNAVELAPHRSTDDGSAIYGTLTSAAGKSGGFLLNVYATTPPLKADCSGDAGNMCTVTRQSDGTSVAVGRWHDPSVPGGITYEVNAVRPDGADISMVLSTEADPKGESTVTSSTLPLTVDQLVAFVTSDQW